MSDIELYLLKVFFKGGPIFGTLFKLDLDLEWFILTQTFAHDVHYKFEYYGHGIIKLTCFKFK